MYYNINNNNNNNNNKNVVLICSLLKEKYICSKYRVHSVFYYLEDHKKNNNSI